MTLSKNKTPNRYHSKFVAIIPLIGSMMIFSTACNNAVPEPNERQVKTIDLERDGSDQPAEISEKVKNRAVTLLKAAREYKR